MSPEQMKRTAGVFADILTETGDRISVPLCRGEADAIAAILRAVAGAELEFADGQDWLVIAAPGGAGGESG